MSIQLIGKVGLGFFSSAPAVIEAHAFFGSLFKSYKQTLSVPLRYNKSAQGSAMYLRALHGCKLYCMKLRL